MEIQKIKIGTKNRVLSLFSKYIINCVFFNKKIYSNIIYKIKNYGKYKNRKLLSQKPR
jgi:hypothetical protein